MKRSARKKRKLLLSTRLVSFFIFLFLTGITTVTIFVVQQKVNLRSGAVACTPGSSGGYPECTNSASLCARYCGLNHNSTVRWTCGVNGTRQYTCPACGGPCGSGSTSVNKNPTMSSGKTTSGGNTTSGGSNPCSGTLNTFGNGYYCGNNGGAKGSTGWLYLCQNNNVVTSNNCGAAGCAAVTGGSHCNGTSTTTTNGGNNTSSGNGNTTNSGNTTSRSTTTNGSTSNGGTTTNTNIPPACKGEISYGQCISRGQCIILGHSAYTHPTRDCNLVYNSVSDPVCCIVTPVSTVNLSLATKQPAPKTQQVSSNLSLVPGKKPLASLLIDKVLAAQVYTVPAILTFDQTTHLFSNHNISLNNIPDGDYNIVIHVDGYLDKQLTTDTGSYIFTIINGAFGKAATAALLPGDIAPQPHGDNFVDIQDLNQILSCYGKTAASCPDKLADLNSDGVIDILDLQLLENNFGILGDSFSPPQFECVTDPSCASSGNTIQLCPLKCTKKNIN